MTLEQVLATQYPFTVIPDQEAGGYVIVFPDLPGCMAQVDGLYGLEEVTDEIRTLWLRTAYNSGQTIPTPSDGDTFRRLQRELAKVTSILEITEARLGVKNEC